MMKHCPRCDEDIPLSDFGSCRNRKDGLNLYCKPCIREKMNLTRSSKREMRSARQPMVLSTKRSLNRRLRGAKTVIDKVRIAISAGIGGQWEIHCATGITTDEVADALAVLVLDRGEVRPKALSVGSLNSWNGENWKYEIAA